MVKSEDDYLKNYELIPQHKGPEMYRNKFAFHEAGNPPDKLYVLSQCMDDFSSVECAQCFTRITNILQACFPATGGRVYLDVCFIRANNYSFYREVTSYADNKRCSDDVETSDEFKMVLKKMLPKMVHKAPYSKGIALYKESWNGTTVHGMPQCWKILDKDMCSSCLADAIDLVYRCMPAKEGRALNAGCFLRYSTYEFAHNTSVAAVRRKEVDFAALDQAMKFLQFKLSTLEKATDCFNKANKHGSRGYGNITGWKRNRSKTLYVNGRSGSREIYNELEVISKAQHKNLVRCLGGCFTIIENFLVYEYLANNSLDCILFEDAKFGSFIGTSRPVTSCWTSNSDRKSQISVSLGYVNAIPIRFISSTTPSPALCNGYMAPEYIAKGRLTKKVDVYSFGVLMLEIISGVKNTKIESDNYFETLVTDAWKHFQSNTTTEIIDESLHSEDQIEEIKREIHLDFIVFE
ncbi:Cysteine-rich RLK 42 [Hibiscus syriacus]|uniref:Cysteine-rich RLK 42 n=1 Tax=Hibiscus syriacus TaxID=106335 RepID=A0A6A3AQ53_HIBSY|nr:Cysteine-rich RLK 42 [Hibiscus syriacus]